MADAQALRPAVEAVVLAAQAVASGAMCGLIWFVQVVHYPLFARVAGELIDQQSVLSADGYSPYEPKFQLRYGIEARQGLDVDSSQFIGTVHRQVVRFVTLLDQLDRKPKLLLGKAHITRNRW
jgi:hypothetical protein